MAYISSKVPVIRRLLFLSITLIAGLSAFTSHNSPVFAESLSDALAAAYLKNPTLSAERARLRAIDEEVARAHAGYRPTITGSADVSYSNTNSNPAALTDGEERPYGYSVTLSQPIFRGGRTVNAVSEAEALVLAGREDLRNVEQSTFLEAVTAYMDVVRDQAIVRLRENNVNVLTQQMTATQDRFNVGEVTKTDVAQATARRSRAVSELNAAQANLKASRANYQRIIGNPPSSLSQPAPVVRLIPRTQDDAITKGESLHPTLLGALYREDASRFAVDRVTGELLPEVSLSATYSKSYDTSSTINDQENTTVTGRVNVPIYEAGEVAARVRQAKQVKFQRRDEVDVARARVRADVIAAWGRLVAAQAQMQSDKSQVDATTTALNGVREEEKVGQRTVLDVLDAEQELLDAQVTLTTTKRDLVVATYSLLSATGRLTVADLGLKVPAYDPQKHYDKVKHKWFGLDTR